MALLNPDEPLPHTRKLNKLVVPMLIMKIGDSTRLLQIS